MCGTYLAGDIVECINNARSNNALLHQGNVWVPYQRQPSGQYNPFEIQGDWIFTDPNQQKAVSYNSTANVYTVWTAAPTEPKRHAWWTGYNGWNHQQWAERLWIPYRRRETEPPCAPPVVSEPVGNCEPTIIPPPTSTSGSTMVVGSVSDSIPSFNVENGTFQSSGVQLPNQVLVGVIISFNDIYFTKHRAQLMSKDGSMCKFRVIGMTTGTIHLGSDRTLYFEPNSQTA